MNPTSSPRVEERSGRPQTPRSQNPKCRETKNTFGKCIPSRRIRCLMSDAAFWMPCVATRMHRPGRDDGIRANVVLASNVGVLGRPIRRFDERRIVRSERQRAGATTLRSRTPQGHRRERHRHPRAQRAVEADSSKRKSRDGKARERSS